MSIVIEENGTMIPRLDDIITITAEYFGVTSAELRLPTSDQYLAVTRRIAIALCYRLTDEPLSDIAQKFGIKESDISAIDPTPEELEYMRDIDQRIYHKYREEEDA